jgi:uncharacterized Ntn-hydrolase superfamily protein
VAGTGAVATQAHANTTYGPEGLRLLALGHSTDEVIHRLVESDPESNVRQVGIVGATGDSATFTGPNCNAWAGGVPGPDYAIQGNILAGGAVVEAMRAAFGSSSGQLADRLLFALRAGDDAGGDSRGRQSAAITVVRDGGGYGGFNDRYLDLRVDDHADPVAELFHLRAMHRLYFDRPSPTDVISLTPGLVTELQVMLNDAGDLGASPTGVYDHETRKALESAFGRENLEERWIDGEAIDRTALDHLRKIHQG